CNNSRRVYPAQVRVTVSPTLSMVLLPRVPGLTAVRRSARHRKLPRNEFLLKCNRSVDPQPTFFSCKRITVEPTGSSRPDESARVSCFFLKSGRLLPCLRGTGKTPGRRLESFEPFSPTDRDVRRKTLNGWFLLPDRNIFSWRKVALWGIFACSRD